MKNVVATIVAILLGLVSVYLVHSYVQSKVGQKAKTVTVVAANRAIQAGSKLTSEALALRELPANALPPGYITEESSSQLLDREIQFPARAGDPILWSMLRTESARPAELVPAGKRAVTFPVSTTASVSNQIQPGDEVDIFCTIATYAQDVKVEGHTVIGRAGRDLKNVETMILLTKVKVLSVDFRTNRRATAGYQENEMSGYGNLTVVATPEEAEAIIFTQAFANLSCVLRNPRDTGHPIDVVPLDLNLFKEMAAHLKKRRSQSE